MKPTIPFSEFSKLELLTGTITKVEEIEGAKNLFFLEVDLGQSGKRKLVAGLAVSYKKTELKGKQIVVIANLEGKEIRGKRSEGMLLAADVSGKPILITSEKKVPNGSKVR